MKVLRREKTQRPVLFEFILNLDYCLEFSHYSQKPEPGSMDHFKMVIEAFRNLGYDYAPVYTWESNLLSFEKGTQESLASRSQNKGAMITDRKSFEKYPWPDPQSGNYGIYQLLEEYLPGGMKLLGFSNGGVLELTFHKGGFALGSGNSIPDFIPMDNYLATLTAAVDFSY